MPKRPFIRKQKRKHHGTNFWDHEYTNPEHLALSTEPGDDFLKFTRFAERHHPHVVQKGSQALDLGCGNGRHVRYLQETYGMAIVGFDTSAAAVAQAKQLCNTDQATNLAVRSIAEPLPLPDASCSIVLDMMTSHFLSSNERRRLRSEILRVLQPGGLLLMKTFLRDDDLHTSRLLKEHPGKEPHTYIHPVIGVPEFVYSEVELREYLEPSLIIKRIYRSHKHKFKGRARKRRTITIYAERISS